jgi:hypothetical protein
MNIELTKEQAEVLRATGKIALTLTMPEEKPKQWEPKRPETGQEFWFINGHGFANKDRWTGHRVDHDRLANANVYLTEEATQADAESDRKRNRLRAWLRENNDDWVADWGDCNQAKWTVVYTHRDQTWDYSRTDSYENVSDIYMSGPNSRKLRDLLNSGEVAL